jgi:hypothetical protein
MPCQSLAEAQRSCQTLPTAVACPLLALSQQSGALLKKPCWLPRRCGQKPAGSPFRVAAAAAGQQRC